MLRIFSHPNVVRLHDLILTHDASSSPPRCLLYAVMDFMDEGDLTRLIHRHGGLGGDQPRTLQRWQVRSIVAQTLSAMAHLHGLRVVHRDIKPANVLCSTIGVIKV